MFQMELSIKDKIRVLFILKEGDPISLWYFILNLPGAN